MSKFDDALAKFEKALSPHDHAGFTDDEINATIEKAVELGLLRRKEKNPDLIDATVMGKMMWLILDRVRHAQTEPEVETIAFRLSDLAKLDNDALAEKLGISKDERQKILAFAEQLQREREGGDATSH